MNDFIHLVIVFGLMLLGLIWGAVLGLKILDRLMSREVKRPRELSPLNTTPPWVTIAKKEVE